MILPITFKPNQPYVEPSLNQAFGTRISVLHYHRKAPTK